MRACRRIAPLLLAAVVVPAQVGAAPASSRVGRVVQLSPQVNGTMPQGPTLQLAPQAEVCEHMAVATQAAARAQIVLGGPPARCGAAGAAGSGESRPPAPGDAATPAALRGTLIMGPNSRVVFERWVIEQATRPEMTLGAQLGEFLVFFLPRPRGLAAGKVQIVTPTATIDLHGTAVCLRVAPDGTTEVAVLEGEVTVRGAGVKAVAVPQGSGTSIAPGQAPRVPSPLSSRSGTLSPQAGGPAFTMPAEALVTTSPLLDLGRPLLDLPKARHP